LLKPANLPASLKSRADAIQVRGEAYLKDINSVAYEGTHFPEAVLNPDASQVSDYHHTFDRSHRGKGGFVPLAAAVKKCVSIPVMLWEA